MRKRIAITIVLLLVLTFISTCLTSCNNVDDNHYKNLIKSNLENSDFYSALSNDEIKEIDKLLNDVLNSEYFKNDVVVQETIVNHFAESERIKHDVKSDAPDRTSEEISSTIANMQVELENANAEYNNLVLTSADKNTLEEAEQSIQRLENQVKSEQQSKVYWEIIDEIKQKICVHAKSIADNNPNFIVPIAHGFQRVRNINDIFSNEDGNLIVEYSFLYMLFPKAKEQCVLQIIQQGHAFAEFGNDNKVVETQSAKDVLEFIRDKNTKVVQYNSLITETSAKLDKYVNQFYRNQIEPIALTESNADAVELLYLISGQCVNINYKAPTDYFFIAKLLDGENKTLRFYHVSSEMYTNNMTIDEWKECTSLKEHQLGVWHITSFNVYKLGFDWNALATFFSCGQHQVSNPFG